MDYKLNKSEKLRSRIAIDHLFDDGVSLMAFPLRAAFRLRPRGENPVQFLISIPKKRIRKAAYRLNRNELLLAQLEQLDLGVDIAFVYLDSKPAPYSVINEKVTTLLTRIAQAAIDQSSTPQENNEQDC